MLFGSAILSSLVAAVAATTSYEGDVSTKTVTRGGEPSVVTWRDETPTLAADADIGLSLVPSYNLTDHDPQEDCPGYKAENVKKSANGLTANLKLAGDNCNVYGVDIEELDLKVEYQDDNRLSVKLVPSHITKDNESHYLIPSDILPEGKSGHAAHSDLDFEYSNDPSFWFKVVRKSTGDTIFSTEGSKLVFENQFIELKTQLPKDHNLFGLGETLDSFKIPPGTVKTLFNADIGDEALANLYGSHPFYVEERFDDNCASSHGVYLRNVHAQDVLIDESSLTWRPIGGSLDLYFFSGPSTKEVVKQYQDVIGLPAMHQYWTLGFHQCRWGYKNVSDLREMKDTYRAHGIPLETIWSDIDYMQTYRDFTLDPATYPKEEFQKLLKEIHDSKQHYIPMVDAAIYIPNPNNESDAYPTFDRGENADVFLRNPDGSLYIGAVWPGYTVFPDWLAENATDWWIEEMSKFHDLLPYDGIWIDMNEVSSFCVGSCGSDLYHLNRVQTIFNSDDPGFDYPEQFEKSNASDWKSLMSKSSAMQATATSTPAPETPKPTIIRDITEERNINHPPYAINNAQSPNDMAVHAVSPNATHQNGVVEYDWHNLYGYQMSIATYKSLEKVFPEKRPFIITRSTFSGSGVWAGHWGGDNHATWADMHYAISQGLSFSLFGMPMFGVDVCGFNQNTDNELCSRWAQLGAFFSFYRNHNGWAYIPQEFYRWSSVEDAAKTAMKIRYTLLPYFYTLLENAHEKGDTFLRALSWEFPDKSLAGIDSQFLVGSSLMVIPVLEPLVDTVEGVFPGKDQLWYDWYNQTKVEVPANQNVTIDAPLGHIPVYIRGGSILPTQDPSYTTTESREGDWGLIVALDKDSKASGDLYVDDGESIKSKSTRIDFSVESGCLKASSKGDYPIEQPLTKITILGVSDEPNHVTLNNDKVDSKFDSKSNTLEISFKSSDWSKGFKLNWD